jgi:hypothetical protein
MTTRADTPELATGYKRFTSTALRECGGSRPLFANSKLNSGSLPEENDSRGFADGDRRT